MDAYTVLTAIGKVLVVVYLVVIPWTFGYWMFLPVSTGLMAFGTLIGVLINKPPEVGSAALIAQHNEAWAKEGFVAFGYFAYYILAVWATSYIFMKWFDRQKEKELNTPLATVQAEPAALAADLGPPFPLTRDDFVNPDGTSRRRTNVPDDVVRPRPKRKK